ncbi:helix-turn-helix domain-containing protein [Dysosmobacter welbionis]|uniref:helix-turn-helix domain-containing protein n=2 Tax=Eubacteriales TaxID=186802 RepID=UPI003993A42B
MCEDRKTHQCCPSVKTIGRSAGMSKNKMHKHTRQLEERELLFTELVEITSRAQKHSGNLLYTLGPTQENRYTL